MSALSNDITTLNLLRFLTGPTACRATGESWALGIGRSGSIAGSLVGGVMLTQGWGLGTVYGRVAIPVTIAGVAILSLGASKRRAAASGL